MIKPNFIKNKIIIWTLTLLIFLPCIIFLSACGNKNYSVNIRVDGKYLYLDMFGSGNISFKKDDLKNMGLTLYGYDVYDYSELKVLINGKENDELFSKNNNSSNKYSDQITGQTIQVGTFMLSEIDENVTITITGAKEKEVSLAFMRADDERLGEDKLNLKLDAQLTFDENYANYIENYSTKLKERDYQYFDTYYDGENIASVTNNGYTSVDWLFKDNKNKILYENEIEGITFYQPYEFKFNASEFFNKHLVTFYTYIKSDGSFMGSSNGEKLDNLPSGTKEYKYQAYIFTNGELFWTSGYDNYAIFEVLSNKKHGYYGGVEIISYEYNFENYGTGNSILDNYGNTVPEVYKPINKENITVQQLRQQSNYVFELYEKNLLVFDFSNMQVKQKNILLSNIDALLSADFSDYEPNLYDIGGVDTKSTFYIMNLPNKIDGVSGIDFSNAEIYVNGTKLDDALGGYEYFPANQETGVEEYFKCYIDADIVEVDCYSKESLLDSNLILNNNGNEKFEITIKNVNFDNATGLSKIKVTDKTNSNLPYISSGTYDDIFLNKVYSWSEDYTAYAYVQTGSVDNSNKILVSFVSYGEQNTTPILTIKQGSDIKEIDVMAQINKGLSDPSSLQDFRNEIEENGPRYISWIEDGSEIKVEFYNSEATVQTIQTISITTQIDASYTDWIEIDCKYI